MHTLCTMDALRDLRQRESVLTAKGREGRLSSVEATELENVKRLIALHESGYAPIGVAA